MKFFMICLWQKVLSDFSSENQLFKAAISCLTAKLLGEITESNTNYRQTSYASPKTTHWSKFEKKIFSTFIFFGVELKKIQKPFYIFSRRTFFAHKNFHDIPLKKIYAPFLRFFDFNQLIKVEISCSTTWLMKVQQTQCLVTPRLAS